MQKTEHLELNLPDGDDYYNVEDFNENAEKIDEVIYEMKQTFQAGVDACYEACETKGSTPASHALSDVVQGILDIETGGGTGDPVCVFPQEDLKLWQCSSSSDYTVYDNDIDLLVAHFEVIENYIIKFKYNLRVYPSSGADYTLYFSFVIDNGTVINNAIVITVPGSSGYDYDPITYTGIYAFTTPFSIGYHTITLRGRCNSDKYSADIEEMNCCVYGVNFIESQYPGAYLLNGNFMQFIPSNFVSPATPLVYYVPFDPDWYYEWTSHPEENLVSYINNNLSDLFDSGNCFYLKGASSGSYPSYCEPPEPIALIDTLSFNNGKIVFSHTHREDTSSEYDYWENHVFVLPITSSFFKVLKFLNIHQNVSSESSYLDYAQMSIYILNRINNTYVEISNNCIEEYIYVEECYKDIDITEIDNNFTNFICIIISTHIDEPDFTVEIDHIFGSILDQRY